MLNRINSEKMVAMKGGVNGVFTEQVRFKNISKWGWDKKHLYAQESI